ncbi:MAG: hypothetical protein JWR45_2657 [Blastococcus sp.]|jgi:hypothetical protein|nr:hypothetical protein [Blastococcus sp.]
MPRYLEHPSKAARWRNGSLEVHPDAAAATQTVWVAVDPAEDGDVVWEGLLARSPAEGRAVIAAVPVFAYDLNLGDQVEVVTSAEGPLVAVRPLQDAGRYTFRVWFPDWPDLEQDERWKGLQVELEPFGCWFDVYSPRLVAVSADPDEARAVTDVLDAGERAGRFIYETGRQSDG